MSEMGEKVGDFVAVSEDGDIFEDPTDGRFDFDAGGSQGAEVVDILGGAGDNLLSQ